MNKSLVLVRRVVGLFALAACIGPPCVVASIAPASTPTLDGPGRLKVSTIPEKSGMGAVLSATHDTLLPTCVAENLVAVVQNTALAHRNIGRLTNNGPNTAANGLIRAAGTFAAIVDDQQGSREVPLCPTA